MAAKGHDASFWSDGNVLRLESVILVQICQYMKNCKNVHLKWMNFTVYKLYLNKPASRNESSVCLDTRKDFFTCLMKWEF